MTEMLKKQDDTLIVRIDSESIDTAFSQNQFEVFYQPQVALSTQNQIIGAEAFIRLNHPKYGVLTPNLFLNKVNQSGRALDLAKVIIDQVVEDLTLWLQEGLQMQVSINIETFLIKDEEFISYLIDKFESSSVSTQNLTIEVSQSNDSEFESGLTDYMLKLRQAGFKFSLDDFGVHSFSEKIISQLPNDELKIHRQIISSVHALTKSRDTVKEALYIADKYGMRTVAVGVESEDTAKWLLSQNCDTGQGFFFGGPSSRETFFTDYLTNTDSWNCAIDNTRDKILIVEPDPSLRNLLVESLGERYDVYITENSREARILFKAFLPNILVVDMELHDSSGPEFVKEMQADNLCEFNTIFTTESNDLEVQLEAFEADGLDILTRPISIIELIAKIGRVVSYQKKRQQLQSNIVDAQEIAQQSMKEAAQYGDVVHLFKDFFHCNTELELSRALFKFAEAKQLNCSIQFRNNGIISSFKNDLSNCSPNEINVFELLLPKGRLFDFGSRTIVNDNHVSILIKNMPNCQEEHGRVRDYIAVIIEGIEARYKDLIRKKAMESVFEKLKGLAMELSEMINHKAQDQNDILEKISIELGMSFHTLDMTEEQEQYLTTIIENIIKEQDKKNVDAENIAENIYDITSYLEFTMNDVASVNKDSPEDDETDSAGGIDLF